MDKLRSEISLKKYNKFSRKKLVTKFKVLVVYAWAEIIEAEYYFYLQSMTLFKLILAPNLFKISDPNIKYHIKNDLFIFILLIKFLLVDNFDKY